MPGIQVDDAGFLSWFEAPAWPGVYLLGTYSRYATLYSQQVRALNLVSALARAERIAAGTPVAVIGGGGAGLTASAAAALLGATVSVFEQLEDVMELQRNNRQRWIHPHIYDWPDPDDDSDRAGLPILDWKAGYAEQVAAQIQSAWSEIGNRTGRITLHRRLTGGVDLVKPVDGQEPRIVWNGPHDQGNRVFPVVIVAVGFGLEPLQPHQWSYWEEDGIDGSFRNRPTPERWVISGFGDSALTDLMRLKIKRFRHAELPQWFRGSRLDSVRRDLLEMHRHPHADTAEFLSQRFQALATNGLEEDLQPRIREDVHVVLTGRTPHLYEPGASILNRFVLRLLFALGAFEHRPGPLRESDIEQTSQGFRVQLGRGPEDFDRVLLRHGPSPALTTLSHTLAADTIELKTRWQKLARGFDRTRDLRWPAEMFQAEHPAPAEAFRREAARVGVSARALTLRKEIFASGRATLRVKIHGLTISRGVLRGVRITIQSMAGKVGRPELNARGHQLGLRWEPDPPAETPGPAQPLAERLAAARKNARTMSGTFHLPEPMTPASAPVTFGFSIDELNADAMTRWEFEQLYSEDDRFYLDHSALDHREFLARVVWFPVDVLRMTVALADSRPDQIPDVSRRAFRWSRDVSSDHIVTDGVLQLAPRPGSGDELLDLGWQPIDWPQDASFAQVGTAAEWQVTVKTPAVGECYAIDWQLPDVPLATGGRERVAEVATVQERLLRHREQRMADHPGALTSPLHQKLLALSRTINATYRNAAAGERMAITLFGYDRYARMLRAVDGTIDGDKDVDQEFWDFALPFGLGLAGTAFKAFGEMYVRTSDGREPALSSFLHVPGQQDDSVQLLLAVALHHQAFETEEPGRMCFGVLGISSSAKDSRILSEAMDAKGLPAQIERACVELSGFLTYALVV